MLLIAGLGNPGQEYTGTRHNVGFEVLGRLSERLAVRFHEGRGDYFFAEAHVDSDDVLLLLPATFMNRSGLAVLDAMEEFQVPPEKVLVVSDDFQLPLGTLRLRAQGSDGGHNGLASVLYELETDAFPRLRCGIGSALMPADRSLLADYVLERFSKDEFDVVRAMIDRAADVCINVLREGVQRTMNSANTRPDPS
jgi:PTH1 family peptidyl-tRNA hydrolase